MRSPQAVSLCNGVAEVGAVLEVAPGPATQLAGTDTTGTTEKHTINNRN